MLIAIDGNEANVANRVGVNNYAYEIIRNLYKLQDKWQERHRVIVYLKDKPLKDLPLESNVWQYRVLGDRRFWVLTSLMPHLWFSRNKPDCLFSPSHYTVPLSGIPRICSIMDLGYLNISGQFKKTTFWQLKIWTAIGIYISKYIIAISKTTKDDIVRHYPFAVNKVLVTHLGYDKQKFRPSISAKDVRRIKQKYSIVGDYILYLGTLKPSKNVMGTLVAYSKLETQNSKLKLVIAGKKGWMYEQIYRKVNELGIEDKVIFTGFVAEKDKPSLLKGAKCLVSPSFTEGFGLHVLEAMAVGVAVVVSSTGSLPEIAGTAGVYVDPYSPKSIANGIDKVLTMDEKRYNMLVSRGIKQAGKFSWEKTASETLRVIEMIQKT